MDTKDIIALMILALVAVLTISTILRFKQINRDRKEMDMKFALKEAEHKARIDRENERERQRAILRQHPNYSNPRFDPKNPDVLLGKDRGSSAVDKILATKRTRGTQSQFVGNNSVGVQSGSGSTSVTVDNTPNDLLTAALLYSMMNPSAATPRTTDEDTGRVELEEPKKVEESTYTSSYTSSNDDSSSSYTSSYSSTSSDSSYSSSYDSSSSSSSSDW